VSAVSAREIDHLLIGGGLACATAAQTLRENGAEGEILLVGREPDLPYHRPPCSKGYLRGSETREDTLVCPAQWYAENDVEVMTRTSVTAVNLDSRTAKLSNKQEVTFKQALIATGANVRRLNFPGCELEEIHYLRALGNADAIRRSVADAEDVVLIGGSFIGCEVAASLTAMGKRCSIVMQESLTLERGLGQRTARFFHDLLISRGVEIHAEDELERIEGDGRVARVLTRRGRELPAQTVVIGAGVIPDSRLAQQAGLEISDGGGVRCTSRLQSSAAGVFAAGDMCEYESPSRQRVRLEHWDVALNQGKTAALNMLGANTPHLAIPYFFCDLADWASLEYVGSPADSDLEITRGILDEGDFLHWYLKDRRVLGALSVGRTEDLDHARRLISDAVVLDEQGLMQLGDPGSDLKDVGV
jgi:3-phenylpropionate/trans-cinnamate dioxygenase ferredoxin reductase component